MAELQGLQCSHCQFENQEEALFCSNCGANLLDKNEMEKLRVNPPTAETQLLFAPFQPENLNIERKIGSGGMAVVYEAVEKDIGRRVALKLLRLDEDADPDVVARFKREAQLAAGLQHPNIIPIYAMGGNANFHYFTMALLEGGNLAARIRDGLDWRETVHYIVQIGSALEYAHQKNLIHRDIKPANIMFNNAGTPILVDFGLAKALSSTKLTATQVLMGTPNYISPEQASGGNVGPHSDLYSLGAMFFEMLTGQVVFSGDDAFAVIFQHINQKPPKPSSINPDIPKVLDDIVLKLLAKKAKDRYRSAGEVVEALYEAFPEELGRNSGTLSFQNSQVEELGAPAGAFTVVADRFAHLPLWARIGILVSPLLLLLLFMFLPRGEKVDPAANPADGVMQARSEDQPPQDLVPDNGLEPGVMVPPDGLVGQVSTDPVQEGDPAQNEVEPETEPETKPKPKPRSKPRQTQPQQPPPEPEPKGPDLEKVRTLLTDLEWAVVTSGNFRMGSRGILNNSDERPTHEVVLSGFELSKREVTQALWTEVMGSNPSCDEGERLPVGNVNWDEAIAFTEKLSELTGERYRLPTEAEWEYASSSGGKENFGPGIFKKSVEPLAWFEENTRGPMPVGGKAPNEWGLFDMFGNVWEWCGDYYSESYYQKSPKENPKGPDSGERRVLRGGAWNSPKGILREANRNSAAQNQKDCTFGLRLVREVKTVAEE